MTAGVARTHIALLLGLLAALGCQRTGPDQAHFALPEVVAVSANSDASAAKSELGQADRNGDAEPANDREPLATLDADKDTDPALAADPGPDAGSVQGPDVAAVDAIADTAPDAVLDTAPDVGPPLPPPKWAGNPALMVLNLHQTWQHDPSSTITASWTTEAGDVGNYVPRLLVAPAGQVDANGADFLSKGKVFQGLGTGYSTPIGSSPGPKVAWHVEATGLLADTDYVARVGTWQSLDAKAGLIAGADLSPPLHFRTTPPPGATTAMQFVLAGDSRNGLPKVAANMPYFTKIPALAWFFNGDMNPAGTQDEWNDWFATMQPILSERPLMAVQGNHEIFSDYYYAQFALPVMPGLPAAYHEHAWSLTLGNAHFVGLDANSDQAVADQVPWLEADLQAATADPNIEWIVATMHHSAYSACSVHGSTARLQQYWVPVFEKYGVDLVFSGHDHDYERTVPILGNKPVAPAQGVQYVVVGAFFAPAYTAGKDWWTAVSVSGTEGNLATLTIAGKLLTVKAYSGDGSKLIDEFSLQH